MIEYDPNLTIKPHEERKSRLKWTEGLAYAFILSNHSCDQSHQPESLYCAIIPIQLSRVTVVVGRVTYNRSGFEISTGAVDLCCTRSEILTLSQFIGSDSRHLGLTLDDYSMKMPASRLENPILTQSVNGYAVIPGMHLNFWFRITIAI